jgi:predicted ATP-grasp superfamily ATP-dependent carboligase
MSLLAATKYRGLVEVEFKYDARDGNYYLLDVNPRVWGWHTLAIRAGVDFPYLAWKYARGEPVDHARGAPGIHWVRFSTDSFAVVLGFLTGELTFSEYLRSMRGPSERAIMSFDDPLPALFEVPLLARLAIRRRAL